MRILRLAVLLSCIHVLLVVQSADSLQIIYPEDGTSIVKSNYLVIKGGGDPQLDSLIVEINGLKSEFLDISSVEYKTYLKDFVILQPEFSAGENSLKVEGFVQGRVVGTSSATIFYQKDQTVIPPGDFRPYVMHTLQREALCSECHEMNPSEEQLLEISAVNNPCASCHKDILSKKNVHGPAGVFRCIFCHDPSSKPSKYKARSVDVDICSECHLGKVEQFSRNKFIHGPVLVGLCSVCHDSHSSDSPAQLLAPINEVCVGCHDKLDLSSHVVRGFSGKAHPLKDVPDPSQTESLMSCVSCHDPHGGANRVFFEAQYSGSSMAICRKCHSK